MKHGSFLLERVIIAFTAAKTIAEVVVVFVIRVRFLGVNAAALGFLVEAQGAWAGRWDSRRAAVACEVSLLEDFDEGMFAMTLDRAGVAHASRSPFIVGRHGGGIACQASEDGLAQ